MKFKSLHKQEDPLLISNVWDVVSAQSAAELKFKAIATSSSAMSALLGYDDGEGMSFSELLFLVKRIAANTDLPLSVDLEGGYSRDPLQIAEHVKALADLGVVGINLEDSLVDQKRAFLPTESFARTVEVLKEQLVKNNIDVFLNIRTDAFLIGHPDPLTETLERLKQYESAGADGIFAPCVETISDIEQLCASTTLPVNVLSMPNLPDFTVLKTLGVKRISMGNFLFNKAHDQVRQLLNVVLRENSFESIFANDSH